MMGWKARRPVVPHTREADRGATAVEYALVVGFIAGTIVGAVTMFGTAVLGLFTSVPPGL